MALPRYAQSFTDSVKSGKDKQKPPRKSIQGYLAVYPRINRQVSSITLQSILAAQIEVAGGMEGRSNGNPCGPAAISGRQTQGFPL